MEQDEFGEAAFEITEVSAERMIKVGDKTVCQLRWLAKRHLG